VNQCHAFDATSSENVMPSVKDARMSVVSGFLGSACRRAAERLHGSVNTLSRFPG